MSTQAASTEQVAKRLVELCRKGEIIPAQEELFDENVKSVETSPNHQGPPVTTGKTTVIEKGKQFSAMIEEVHGSSISDPVVAGRWFSISWLFDVTIKGMGRQKMEEICVYEVKDGKIVSEQFFG
jgi:hypothetical protein